MVLFLKVVISTSGVWKVGKHRKQFSNSWFDCVIPERKRDKEEAFTGLFRSKQRFAVGNGRRTRRKVQE